MQALLDEMGAEKGCLAVNQDGQCIIGRQEAFYIYTPDGRGPCFVFEGGLEDVQGAQSHPPAVPVCRKGWPCRSGSFLGYLPAVPGQNGSAFPAAEGVSPFAVRYASSGKVDRSVHSLLYGRSHDAHSTQAALCLPTGHPYPCLA